MSYTFTSEEKDGYLRNTFSGVLEDDDLDLLVEQIGEQYKKAPRRCYLSDVRNLESKLSPTGLFNVIQALQDILPPGTRMVHLVRPGQTPHGDFVETASSNRGILLRYYEDEDKAIAWLTDPH